MPHTAFLVLPASNEAESLPDLLDRLAETMEEARIPYRVIVVDDGSTDHTQQVLDPYSKRMDLQVVVHEHNQGLAAALRDGLKQAAIISKPGDCVFTMDADGTHPVNLMPRMLSRIREGYDVVIASRYRPQSRTMGLSRMRRVMSYGASWLFRIAFRFPGVRDYTCGFRAYRAECLQAALKHYGERFLDEDGFQCTADILLKIGMMRATIGEVDFILRNDLKRRESKMNVPQTVVRTLRLLIKRRLGQ